MVVLGHILCWFYERLEWRDYLLTEEPQLNIKSLQNSTNKSQNKNLHFWIFSTKNHQKWTSCTLFTLFDNQHLIYEQNVLLHMGFKVSEKSLKNLKRFFDKRKNFNHFCTWCPKSALREWNPNFWREKKIIWVSATNSSEKFKLKFKVWIV